MPEQGFVPIRYTIPWPHETLPLPADGPLAEILDRVGVSDFDGAFDTERDALVLSATVQFLGELVADAPGITGVAVAFNSAGGVTSFSLGSTVSESLVEIRLLDLNVALRLTTDLFVAMRREGDRFVRDETPSGAQRPFSVTLENIDIQLTFADVFSFDLLDSPSITLTPVGISDTGVIIEADSMTLRFSDAGDPPPGFDAAWRGVYIPRAMLHLPEIIRGLPSGLVIENAGIGAGGFSGSVAVTWRSESAGHLEAELAGFGLRLYEVALAFEQNVPKSGAVQSALKLPFFEEWLGLDLGLKADGTFLAKLKALDGGDLITLRQEDLFELTVESIGLEAKDSKVSVSMGGALTPLVLGDEGIQWPSFEIEELSIDSDGNVDFEGGWMDFPQQQTLDFNGFKITLSELGFGSETATRDGIEVQRQWLGVSGGINLLEGVPISASVEGLKVSWDPTVPGGDVDVSMEGIGVSLEIPNTLRLAGAVRYESFDDGLYEGKIVRGQIELNIMALRMVIGGELIIGHLTEVATGNDFDVAYVVLNAQFPTAIPLGATGAGLYGLLGLVGVNVAPDRHSSVEAPEEPEAWYEWYKADRGPNSARNVTKMQKWEPKPDHYAFGAGLTVGTVYDDGYTVNVRALLAVLIPGPVIMIEGRANLLKSRSEDGGEEAAFYALAVFDGIAGTFQLNVDVQYELEEVVTVGGGVEAFFDFNDAKRWHLWLGQKEPRSKRIRAQILSLFRVDLYLMIDNNGLLTGASAALSLREEYGPLELVLEIGLSFDAGIYWNPPQCEGRLELLIELAIRVFGIGIGILIQMLLEAKAATPFWVHGIARFAVNLPFPLPSFDAQVEFTWEEPTPPEPVWPLLKTVELTHPLAKDAVWYPTESADSPLRPVVPVDALAVAKFARPLVGRSYRTSEGGAIEPMGHDPVDRFTLSYICESVVLNERKDAGDYRPIAKSPLSAPDEFEGLLPLDVGAESLITGSDAQEPEWRLWKYDLLPGSSVYEREDSAEQLAPCPAPVDLPSTCVDFLHLASGSPFGRVFTLRGWQFRTRHPRLRGGRLEFSEALWVHFAKPMRRIDVRMSGRAGIRAFFAGAEVARPDTPADRADSMYTVSFDHAGGIDALLIEPRRGGVAPQAAKLRSICAVERDALDAVERLRDDSETAGRHLDGGTARRLLLCPNSDYRIDVHTRVRQSYQGGPPSDPEPTIKSFYFRTGDGPGADLLDEAARLALETRLLPDDESSLPVEQRIARLNFAAGSLNTIRPYIEDTLPNPRSDPFYFELDVQVVFRNRLVRDAYSEGYRLDLRFRDLNGNAVPAETASIVDASWISTLLPLASAGQLTWEAQRERKGCGGVGGGPVEGAPALWTTLADAKLAPRRRYLAELVLAGPADEKVLYDFSFVTSDYPSPAALLESGLRALASDDAEAAPRQIVRHFQAPAATVADTVFADALNKFAVLKTVRGELRAAHERNEVLHIHDRAAEAKEAHSAFLSAAAAAHTEVAMLLGVQPSHHRPPQLELFATHAARGLLLRLESPEPFAWTRWRIVLRIQDGDSVRSLDLVPICNLDRTSAILAGRAGDAHIGPGEMTLTFEYLGADTLDQPELSVAGGSYVPDPVTLSLMLESR